MANPFEELARLDHLVHEPARLAILTALSACRTADFLFLQSVTGLSSGNLSSHLTKLEAAGLLTIEKDFVGRTPRTRVELTETGRKTIDRHWQTLKRLKDRAGRWSPGEQ